MTTAVASGQRREGTVLALDFGQRRTGLAVGELTLGIAHPLKLVETTDADQRRQDEREEQSFPGSDPPGIGGPGII